MPYADPVTGERKRRSKYVSTRAEAEAVLEEWRGLGSTEHATQVQAPTTVRELLTRYLQEKEPGLDRAQVTRETGWQFTAEPCLDRTWRDYESLARVNILPTLGNVLLRDLDAPRVRSFLQELSTTTSERTGRTLSQDRLNNVRRFLHAACAYAVGRGFMLRNPVSTVSTPRPRRVETARAETAAHERALSRAEYRAFMAYLDEHYADDLSARLRWRVFAFSLGLRQGEALGLTWDRVDLDGNRVSIRQQAVHVPYEHGCEGSWQGRVSPCSQAARIALGRPDLILTGNRCPDRKGGGWFIAAETKTSAIGYASLTDAQVALLRELHGTQEHDKPGVQEKRRLERVRAQALYPIADADLVLRSPRGTVVTKVTDNKQWHSILAGAGVSSLGRTVHAARATTATMMIEAGVPLAVVSQVLRHSSFAVTRRYVSRVESGVESAQDTLAQYLDG